MVVAVSSDIEFKVVTANGLRHRLAIQGKGPLVVLCHGWPESWYSWRHQIPAIANAGFTAVAHDVRGYGESDKPHAIEAYTLKELAADVVGIADALGHETFITIGHDWGGPIGLGTTVDMPEKLKKIVVFNSTCELDGKYPWQIRTQRYSLRALLVRSYHQD